MSGERHGSGKDYEVLSTSACARQWAHSEAFTLHSQPW